jgi:hypothetical protein
MLNSFFTTTYDPWADFIKDHFHYDKISENLKVLDEEFVSELRTKQKDAAMIQNHFKKILCNHNHALVEAIDAFVDKFQKKYVLEDTAWLNLKDCIIDINHFTEKLVLAFIERWKNSYINTEFALGIIEAVVKQDIIASVFQHLIHVYRLQSNNKEIENHLGKLFQLTLEDLNLANEFLLLEENDPYSVAIYALNDILNTHDPNEMVKIILKTSNGIHECLQHVSNLSDEELLPISLYVVIRANIPELSSLLQFISDFGHGKYDSESQFALSMFNSALKWSLNVDVPQEWSGTPVEKQDHEFEGFGDEPEESPKGTNVPLTDLQKSNEIKDLEAEINELYKELKKHMDREREAEDEIFSLKSKLQSFQEGSAPKNFMSELQSKLKPVTKKDPEVSRQPNVKQDVATPPRIQPKVETVKPEIVSPRKEIKPEVVSLGKVEIAKPEVVSPSVSPRKVESIKTVITSPISPNQSVSSKLIPLTVTIQESLSIQYQGKTLEKYELSGDIGVKPLKTNDISDVAFDLYLSNLNNVSIVGNNQRFSKMSNMTNNLVLNCRIPKGDLVGNVGLLRYEAKKEYQPLPIKIQSVFKLNKGSLDVMIHYVVNPEYFKQIPLESLSIRFRPLIHQDGQLVLLKKCVAKPEGQFDEEKQTYEWVFNQILSEEQPQKMILQFVHSLDDISNCVASIPALQAKITCSKRSFGGIIVEGCDGKENKSGETFLGGLEQGVTQGSLVILNK